MRGLGPRAPRSLKAPKKKKKERERREKKEKKGRKERTKKGGDKKEKLYYGKVNKHNERGAAGADSK